ncbi:hypothetical protein, partial [Escherichia coli]|uniref:hypothetical protein n=1 Tax=Escherichia coli TaxID=562 RepID=UPI0032DB8E9A
MVYPNLVNQFYQNMKVKTTNQVPVLTSIVKGVRISFDPPKLGRLLNLALGGVDEYERSAWVETPEVGFRDYLRYMTGQDEDIALNTRPDKHNLTGEQRILTLLVAESLLPNRNNSRQVTAIECAFAYFLKHRVKFDLPTLMILHMDFCKIVKRRNRPYGMILSWLFQQRRVNVTGELVRQPVHSAFNAPSLQFSGLFQVEGNEYITAHELSRMPADESRELIERYHIPHKRLRGLVEPQQAEQAGDDEGEDESEEEAEEEEPMGEADREHRRKEQHDPLAPTPPVGPVLRQLQEMQRMVEARFDSLDLRVDRGFQ